MHDPPGFVIVEPVKDESEMNRGQTVKGFNVEFVVPF